MAEVGDVLAGTSLAEADDSAIEARLRELEERTGPSRVEDEGETNEAELGTTATISLIEARLAELRASFARDESAFLGLSLAGSTKNVFSFFLQWFDGSGDAALPDISGCEPPAGADASLEANDAAFPSLQGTGRIDEEGDQDDEEQAQDQDDFEPSKPSATGLAGQDFADLAQETGLGTSLAELSNMASSSAAPPEPGPVVLNGPHAVLVASGKVRCIVIADCWANGLTMVTSEGMVLASVGGRGEGHLDDRIQSAAMNGPHGLCRDKHGNIFVADAYNQAVRRVTPLALNEAAETVEELVQACVLTVAGTSGQKGLSDGPAKSCTFCYPHDVEVHYLRTGTALLVADFDNNCIRRVTLHQGVGEHVVTWAGSNLAEPGLHDARVQDARFNHPGGLARLHGGDDADIFVADTYNHAIRVITLVDGQWEVKTIAGGAQKGFADGVGQRARFNCPTGIAVGSYGDVYVADFSNHAIRMLRKQARDQWSVTTLLGCVLKGQDGADDVGVSGFVDGSLHEARLNRPHGVTYDPDFDIIYVADCMNNRVRCIRGNRVWTLV